MATTSSTAESAKAVRENIARAKGYLRREEILRALEAGAEALSVYGKINVIGNTRFEIEVNLDETLMDISRRADISTMLPPGKDGKPFLLRYVRGKEALLSTALRRMVESLKAQAVAKEQERLGKIEQRKQELLTKGQDYLDAGDIPRARTFLRRVMDEFGAQPGILVGIAGRYRSADLLMEAAEVYEYAIEQFPRESVSYVGAIGCYMELREYEKVERLYERVLQQFGLHPRTLCNMAKFYLLWRKKGKASDCAYRALTMDPTLEEARQIMQEVEGVRS